MIVVFLQILREIASWDAISGYVVRGLDVEGLFNLGVRSDEEMEDDESRDQGIEEDICDLELTYASL
jgi:hypothetical protein